MSSEQYLARAVINAEFNSVNGGLNGSTAQQVAAAGELKETREALGKYLGVSPECDLFKAALDSQRSEHEQWIAGLCYTR